MKNNLIQKTNESISPLGFGAMRLPVKKGKVDRNSAKKQIYYAIDKGINFIDTAAVYGDGDNEEFLGEILQGEYSNVNVCSKLPIYKINSKEEFENTLNQQLKRLKRDCIDYYLLHNTDFRTINKMIEMDIFDFLDNAKKEGKIRYTGFSYHGSIDKFNEIVDFYDWDIVMLQYNYLDNNITSNKEMIDYAYSKGMGIFIMEPLKGGLLAGKMPNPIEIQFRNANSNRSNASYGLSWILNNPKITCVLSGMNSIEQIKENIDICKNAQKIKLNSDELKAIDNARKMLQEKIKVKCTTCRYCLPCPQGVDIPYCFDIYNKKYLFDEKRFISKSLIDYFYFLGAVNHDYYSNAGLCNKCGKCVKKCPQNIKIPKELKKVKKEFEKPGFKIQTKIVKKIIRPLYKKLF